MRLWSLAPTYLDSKGLVACWREGLLARKVLQGETRGYTHHPQLARFRAASDPVEMLDAYLLGIHAEAVRRGYTFDRGKIGFPSVKKRLSVTEGQLRYELGHLLAKLRVRDPERYERLRGLQDIQPHPIFTVVPGEVEVWERVV